MENRVEKEETSINVYEGERSKNKDEQSEHLIPKDKNKESKRECLSILRDSWDIAKLAGPIFLGILFQNCNSVIGAAILASYDKDLSADAVVAATLQSLLMTPVTSIFFSTGTEIATKYGQNDTASIRQIMIKSLMGAAMASVPVIIGAWTVRYPLELFKYDSSIINSVQSYMAIYSLGVMPNLANFIGNQLFTGTQRTAHLLLLDGATLVSEVVLDVVFVTGLKLGMKGLALARIGQAWLITAGLFAVYKFHPSMADFNFLRKANNYSFLSDLKDALLTLWKGFPIGSYMAAQLIVMVLQMLVLRSKEEKLSVLQGLFQFIYLTMPATLAIAQAANSKVGMLNGAKDFHSARRIGNISLFLGIGATLLIGIPITACAVPFTGLFSDDLHDFGEDFIRGLFAVTLFTQISDSIKQISTANLRGIDKIFKPSIINLVSTIALVLPLTFLLFYLEDLGLYAITSSLAIGSLVSGTANCALWQYKIRQLIKFSEGPALLDEEKPDEERLSTPKASKFKSYFFSNPKQNASQTNNPPSVTSDGFRYAAFANSNN